MTLVILIIYARTFCVIVFLISFISVIYLFVSDDFLQILVNLDSFVEGKCSLSYTLMIDP